VDNGFTAPASFQSTSSSTSYSGNVEDGTFTMSKNVDFVNWNLGAFWLGQGTLPPGANPGMQYLKQSAQGYPKVSPNPALRPSGPVPEAGPKPPAEWPNWFQFLYRLADGIAGGGSGLEGTFFEPFLMVNPKLMDPCKEMAGSCDSQAF